MSEKTPFKRLGGKLKSVREERKESLVEVSGAVEIEAEALAQIEAGAHRPSQDILLLLLSHFDIVDDEAAQFMSLAGYSELDSGVAQSAPYEFDQPMAMVTPMDLRVVYTDMVHVMINNYGVIMNFMQGAGPNNQPLAVARVGMSKEHAQSVLEVLQKTLVQANQPPKALPADSDRTNKSAKTDD
jgi:transcriptional regulator with XRE-family HTH domain